MGIVAVNGGIELPSYYVPWLNKQTHAMNEPHSSAPGNCSAFIATGSYTKGGKIVIAHNNWSSYADGERWTMMFDIQPAKGHRFLMDGQPGVITSQDDFGVNDARADDNGDDDYAVYWMESRGRAGVCAFEEGDAVRELD